MKRTAIVLGAILLTKGGALAQLQLQPQKPSQQPPRAQKEDNGSYSKKFVRENLDDLTKRLCLERFSDPERVKVLAPFATVSQMCQCIIGETSFAISDDLAKNLLLAQLDQGAYKKISKKEVDNFFEKYSPIYQAASSGCGEEFIRRRR